MSRVQTTELTDFVFELVQIYIFKKFSVGVQQKHTPEPRHNFETEVSDEQVIADFMINSLHFGKIV